MASLGGDVSSVKADFERMQARSLKTTGTSAYALHEIQAPNGTTVREYVSPRGTVFAVTWRGAWLPNLEQLLGSYFGSYQAAAQDPNRKPSRGPLVIHQGNLVVESSGHMRDFSGRAYLLDQLPAGVDLESIH